MVQEATPTARTDKWLWAARFYKTRGLAAGAIRNRQVKINGVSVKPARLIKAGDQLSIRRGRFVTECVVREICDNRGPAVAARTMYQETSASQKRRQLTREQLQNEPKIRFHGRGRPNKRERRAMARLMERELNR